MSADANTGADRPVVGFDHHDAELARDPYPQYEALRTRCPVAWTD